MIDPAMQNYYQIHADHASKKAITADRCARVCRGAGDLSLAQQYDHIARSWRAAARAALQSDIEDLHRQHAWHRHQLRGGK